MLTNWQTKASLALAVAALIVVAVLLNVQVDVGASPGEVAQAQRWAQEQTKPGELVVIAFGPEAHCGAVFKVISRHGINLGGESPLNEHERRDACVAGAAPYARWAILAGALALLLGAYAGRRTFVHRPSGGQSHPD